MLAVTELLPVYSLSEHEQAAKKSGHLKCDLVSLLKVDRFKTCLNEMLPQKQVEKIESWGKQALHSSRCSSIGIFFNVATSNTNEKLKSLLNFFLYSSVHNNKITKSQEN